MRSSHNVNTILGDLKTAIAGTSKAVARRYVPRYLAEFQYRLNRRCGWPEMLPRLACVATCSAPAPARHSKSRTWLGNQALLTQVQCQILRNEDTEPPFPGPLDREKRRRTFACAANASVATMHHSAHASTRGRSRL